MRAEGGVEGSGAKGRVGRKEGWEEREQVSAKERQKRKTESVKEQVSERASEWGSKNTL